MSQQRLVHYKSEAFDDEDQALQLYEWDRDLSAAFYRDIAIVEVALRNALDRALTDKFGERWDLLSSALFDQRTWKGICEAWERLPSSVRDRTGKSGKTRGRLVASCMFGTWANMLDKGSSGESQNVVVGWSHEKVWDKNTLLVAFPGGQLIANSEDHAEFNRSWCYIQVHEVHVLRNRIAHHEPLIRGYPLPGTGNSSSPAVRRSAEQGFDAVLRLAAMIDRDLTSYLEATTRVAQLLESRPSLKPDSP
ncbi:MAG TPA: Abi family protein [Candidatus Corynebacterium gallistercoris]|uniref:Abi family protein n=1 Tax=Candidatus Corynebacterium gallistercoris TaxID=2838530 RepID=A0A9D1UQ91_9CORY|nr:Abi family protein [Candidatus Corynebacterium gallistercoris]